MSIRAYIEPKEIDVTEEADQLIVKEREDICVQNWISYVIFILILIPWLAIGIYFQLVSTFIFVGLLLLGLIAGLIYKLIFTRSISFSKSGELNLYSREEVSHHFPVSDSNRFTITHFYNTSGRRTYYDSSALSFTNEALKIKKKMWLVKTSEENINVLKERIETLLNIEIEIKVHNFFILGDDL